MGCFICIYLRYLPIEFRVVNCGLLKKGNIVNIFFLEIYNFFSNCEIQILIFGVHESPMWITHQIYNICNIWCSPKKWKKYFENLPFRDDFYTYTKTLKFVVNFSPHATCIWQVHEKSKMSKNELFSLLIPIKIK